MHRIKTSHLHAYAPKFPQDFSRYIRGASTIVWASSITFSFTLGAQLEALDAVCCTLFTPAMMGRNINFPQTCFWCCCPQDQCSTQLARTNGIYTLGAEGGGLSWGHWKALSTPFWLVNHWIFFIDGTDHIRWISTHWKFFFLFYFCISLESIPWPNQTQAPYLLIAYCLSLRATV